MNLFNRLFGHPSLTATWRADPSVPLTVDLGTCEFCGVPLGAAVERLAHLGPSAHQQLPGPETALVYPQLGLQIFLEDSSFDTVDIYLLADTDMTSFAGRWYLHGQPLAIDVRSTRAHIQTLLGAPANPTGMGLFYARAKNGIEIEWNEAGELENIMLYTLSA